MNRALALKYIFGLLLCLLTIQVVSGQNRKRIIDLKTEWKFSIGEHRSWIRKDFNDASWVKIKVPSSWEDQGFHGYNGYAFYRKVVGISERYRGHLFFLNLGYIDDVDQVYFNGELIGTTGSFPPNYETAYNAGREYYIPEHLISYDSPNLIVIKVYDLHGSGGIVSGDPGLYASQAPLPINVHLSGYWKFKPGDNMAFKNPQYDDGGWDKIFVPATWEDQGYRDLDGIGWYRKTFRYTENTDDEKVALILGKINDFEGVYLNGKLVGGMKDFDDVDEMEDYWKTFRGYIIQEDLLKRRNNVIAVQVYDWGNNGGIYEGPIGITSQKKYIEYWHKRRKK